MDSIISINPDSFIYAVRQAFDARSRANGEFNSHLKYTPFLENTWEKPAKSSISALKESLDDILKHHWNVIPYYQRHESVNLENISWFAHSMAVLFADIDSLLKSVLGHGIPQKDTESPESSEIWDLINQAVQNNFHEYAPLFNAYAEWKYNPLVEKKEAVDWNVRPPCGLLYKTEFKALFDEIRRERFGKKSSHSNDRNKRNTDQKPKSAPSDKDSHAEKNSQPDKNVPDKDVNEGSATERPHKRDHQSRNPRERGERGNRREDRGAPKQLREDSAELLKPALDECKKAVETMKNNPNIHEIPLSAQNSFIRRHQHTFITDAGFDSDSRGEAAGRHVCIIKK